MQKMGDMAESKRNMTIDWRPRVVMRVLRFELILALCGLSACFLMPFYFLKIVPARQRLEEELEEKKEQDRYA